MTLILAVYYPSHCADLKCVIFKMALKPLKLHFKMYSLRQKVIDFIFGYDLKHLVQNLFQ